MFFSGHILAQKKCATEIFNNQILKEQPFSKNPEIFEEWLNKKLSLKKNELKLLAQAEILNIPVVIHIIHSGEPVGEGANISEEQISTQLETLNNDFRRMNEDAGMTPADFLPVASDTEIQFSLARQDPNGLPTNGIVRIEGPKPTYAVSETELVSSISNWPTDQYLNIWVYQMDQIDYLGLAQYPIADLDGLQNLYEINSNTDGVFINYPYFGQGEVEYAPGNFYSSRGRTVTHEVGHWLGLRHIWGDGGCGVDDYCSDTPAQSVSTVGCPEAGTVSSCDNITMFQNYMDYTDDLCLNLFTTCQTDRMRAVLEFASGRNRLLTSPGLIEPTIYATDLAILEILEPSFGSCESIITPQLIVQNQGINNIESFGIEVLINDEIYDFRNFTSPLSQYVIDTISFSLVPSNPSIENFTFKISHVNDDLDQNEENNCEWIESFFPTTTTIPIFEDFESSEESIRSTWTLRNTKTSNQWSFAPAPSQNADNASIKLNYFESPIADQNGIDMLISPALNLTGVVTVDLSFKYAYSKLPTKETDALMVIVSTDCGATFPDDNIIFHRWADGLNTTNSVEEDFTPINSSDWSDVEINFGEFANQENVVIAIGGRNGGGNNIYLDDIEISSSNVNELDIKIQNVESIPVVTCLDNFQPRIEMKNSGLSTINSFDFTVRLGEYSLTESYGGLNLLPGKSEEFSILTYADAFGEQILELEISNPNGGEDEDLSNNFHSEVLIVDDETETAPLKESFTNSSSYNKWSFISKDSDSTWAIYQNDNIARAAVMHGYAPTELDANHWLVSPTLDLSAFDEASLQFDLSYANRVGRDDRLRVLGSTNCGTDYEYTLFNKAGENLALSSSNEAWFPDSEADWAKETIDLSQFAGEDNLRLAFVFNNQRGNNLFIDNIEIFDVAEPPMLETENTLTLFPNPTSVSFQIALDFALREENLTVRLLTVGGEIKAEWKFENALNQVYLVDNLDVMSGMYLVHVFGSSTNLTERIFIQSTY